MVQNAAHRQAFGKTQGSADHTNIKPVNMAEPIIAALPIHRNAPQACVFFKDRFTVLPCSECCHRSNFPKSTKISIIMNLTREISLRLKFDWGCEAGLQHCYIAVQQVLCGL